MNLRCSTPLPKVDSAKSTAKLLRSSESDINPNQTTPQKQPTNNQPATPINTKYTMHTSSAGHTSSSASFFASLAASTASTSMSTNSSVSISSARCCAAVRRCVGALVLVVRSSSGLRACVVRGL